MESAPYTRTTEIRNVAFQLDSLASILQEDWRTLFYLIPARIADIDRPPGSYTTKYNGTQERELDDYGARQNASRAALLLDEWGTSGKRGDRPTLDHLQKLLIKGHLMRAADYVAKDLLNEPPPERPRLGPAAPIDIQSVLDRVLESALDRASYPESTALQNGLRSLTLENNVDRQMLQKRDDVIGMPPVVPDSIADGSLPQLSNSDNNEQSGQVSGGIPMISALLGPEASHSGLNAIAIVGNTLSSTSDSYSDSSSSSSSEISQHRFMPDLPMVLGTIQEDDETPNLSIFGRGSPEAGVQESSSNVPRFSALFNNSGVCQSPSEDSDSNIPQLSAIGFTNGQSSEVTSHSSIHLVDHNSSTTNSNLIEFSSSTISSPSLVRFPYAVLKTATANFDERRFTNGNLANPDGRLLGSGGFGTVFLCLNLSPSAPLTAVKRLFPSNYKYREKFDREREILSQHSHPNIVKLLGYSEDDSLCLVYEFLPDGTLEGILRKCRTEQFPFPACRRLSYLFGIASAMEFLHSTQVQVIHRDVTLANILLHEDTAKLCDFGLIKRVSSTTTTGVIGTGPYLAPEALRGSVTPALDVYSYGVVLAEVVTGRGVLEQEEYEGGRDFLELITAEDANLGAIVDRQVRSEEIVRWTSEGEHLLALARKCLSERHKRPKARDLREQIEPVFRRLAG